MAEYKRGGTASMIVASVCKRKATKQVGNGDGFQVFCDRCLNKARRLIAPIANTKAVARSA